MQIMMRPTIAIAMGDPAGISAELTARLLALHDVAARARLVVIGDHRVLDDGARVATVRLELKTIPLCGFLETTGRRGFHRSRLCRSVIDRAKHRYGRKRQICDRGVTLLGGFDFPMCTPAERPRHRRKRNRRDRSHTRGHPACDGNGACSTTRPNTQRDNLICFDWQHNYELNIRCPLQEEWRCQFIEMSARASVAAECKSKRSLSSTHHAVEIALN
jgi:hypothetical protein